MLRLFSRPGVLTGLVVMASVGSGIAFGIVGVSAALALREAGRRLGGKADDVRMENAGMTEGL